MYMCVCVYVCVYIYIYIDTYVCIRYNHFEARREKRKTEMDGLEEAKNFLAGGFEMTV